MNGPGICKMRCYIFLISFRAIQVSVALPCQDGQLVVKLPSGDLSCENCPMCPPGFGVTLPCRNTDHVPSSISMTCKACLPGEYSNSLSSERCKTCSKCLPDEEIVANCTIVSDTRCRCKPCPKGYYRNKTISKCLPCSSCCFFDGADEVVPQCVSQGLPRSQTCSYQERKSCSSKCWYDEITVLDRDEKWHSCQLCPVCSKNMGLTVPCGSITSEDKFIGCELPTLAKTFLNFQGVIQSCSICPPGQGVVANCSYKSDTSCGGCKEGFYYNPLSGSCQECFLCCSLSDSDAIMQCIKEGTFSGITNYIHLSLFRNTQQSVGAYGRYCLKSLWELNKLTLTTGFIMIIFFSYFAFNFVTPSKHNSNNKVQDPFSRLKITELVTPLHRQQQQEITPETAEDGQGTKKMELEYPAEQNTGHLFFEKTGVEVIALCKNKTIDQSFSNRLALQATSDSTKHGFLKEDEIQLSPVITFISTGKNDGLFEVQIPHGANMILSRSKWNVMLKKLLNNRWVTVSQSGQGIHSFSPKSNHVSFETNRLSTFVVVGKLQDHSLPAFKRMKVAAFCSETSIGNDLTMRVYCFDDCEYSFEKLMKKEKREGGKLISSIESLDFIVTSEKDVEITVKDTEGWQLHQPSSMKLKNSFLRSSFDVIPRCDLIFHPTTNPGKNTFFVMVTLAQEPSNQSVMYASSGIKKMLQLPRIQKYKNKIHRDDELHLKGGSVLEAKQIDSDECIIQM